jgi:hypothetical protein
MNRPFGTCSAASARSERGLRRMMRSAPRQESGRHHTNEGASASHPRGVPGLDLTNPRSGIDHHGLARHHSS